MKRKKACEVCGKRVAIIVTHNKDRHTYCAKHGRKALTDIETRKWLL